MSNKIAWESSDLVNDYVTTRYELQKPEKTIFEMFRSYLPKIRMLDIGIGTGRTTAHFSPIAKEYIGIDYSKKMIENCKVNFSDKRLTLSEGDVRNLGAYPDNYFDLVLFSFNGLDYINHQDRLIAFNEMKRVLKPNGSLVFSTHNLNGVKELDAMKNIFHYHPIQLAKNFIKSILFSVNNPSRKELLKRDWTTVYEIFGRYKVETYFIKPSVQIAQLEAIGFQDIQAYDLANGQLLSPMTIDKNEDPWIYYKCQKPMEQLNNKRMLNGHPTYHFN